MIIYLSIGILVEIVRMIVRHLRKLWTFEDFKKNPWLIMLEVCNVILTAIVWPITIMLEIIEYFVRKKFGF